MAMIEFVGSEDTKSYSGNGYNFSMDDKESLIQDVPDEQAEQMLVDFPDWFKSVGKKAKAKAEEPVEAPAEESSVDLSSMTKDELNDYAAQNYPDVKLSARMKKAEMRKAIEAVM